MNELLENQEEWEAEEERNKIAEEKATNEALIKNFDDIKARIEADRILAEKLQEQEREQFTIEERAKFFYDTIAAQRKFLARQRSEAIRNRPPTKNQLRNQMMTYLKHVGNFKHSELKSKKFEDIQAMYEKIKRSDEDFIAIGSVEDDKLIKRMNKKDSSKGESQQDLKLKSRKRIKEKRKRERESTKENDELRLCLTITTDEDKEIDYEILDKKYPIIDWKTENHGTKPQFDESKRSEEINIMWSSSYSGGLVDPSNLHLKKELTKAARALRDPGTTSSWRSPLTSSRSHTALALSVTNTASANHYNHHYRLEQTADNSNHISNTSNVNINANANVNASGSSNNNYLSNNGNGSNNRSNKEKKVFLYNWRTQRSESERSASVTGHQKMSIGDGEESVDDSLSDARNDGDLRMCDSNVVTPPVRKVGLVKKKTKRGLHSSAALKFQLQRQMNMVDQYDDVNSDDVVVKGTSVTSPLLSRIRASKLLGGGSRKDDSSYCYSTPALSTSSFNKYWVGNPSTVGSWDGATGSLNDGDDGDDDDDDDDENEQMD
ncbi:hypothetical protein Tco_0838908 [Tanacetum coccineum]|uniref:Uncharacterized protein n=1 Tax=Tanacetum coccineum TaxID=301880 RepID=A0ABQ5AP55_9ASTR